MGGRGRGDEGGGEEVGEEEEESGKEGRKGTRPEGNERGSSRRRPGPREREIIHVTKSNRADGAGRRDKGSAKAKDGTVASPLGQERGHDDERWNYQGLRHHDQAGTCDKDAKGTRVRDGNHGRGCQEEKGEPCQAFGTQDLGCRGVGRDQDDDQREADGSKQEANVGGRNVVLVDENEWRDDFKGGKRRRYKERREAQRENGPRAQRSGWVGGCRGG